MEELNSKFGCMALNPAPCSSDHETRCYYTANSRAFLGLEKSSATAWKASRPRARGSHPWCVYVPKKGRRPALIRRRTQGVLPLKHLAGDHANRQLVSFQRVCHGPASGDRWQNTV